MRFFAKFIFVVLSLDSCLAQGTFLYDQQSVTNDSRGAESVITIQSSQPVGQSFTPQFSSVGFVRLFLADDVLNGVGATLYVDLRADSITGQIIGSSQPVFMPAGFVDRVDFFFGSPVTVSPGTTYFLQPIVQSGD